jgi:hypothetical protein
MVQMRNGWQTLRQWHPRIRQLLQSTLKIALLFFSLYGGYLMLGWWQDDDPVVTYEMGEVSSPTAHPGDILIFHQPVKKAKSCWGTMQRLLVGECGFFTISEAPSWVLSPWNGRLTYAIQIPSEAIPGQCGFQVVGRFICNPFDLFGKPRISESTPIHFLVLRFDNPDQ